MGIKSWFESYAPQALEHFPVLLLGSPKPFGVLSSLGSLKEHEAPTPTEPRGTPPSAGVCSLHTACLEPLSQLGSSCIISSSLCFLLPPPHHQLCSHKWKACGLLLNPRAPSNHTLLCSSRYCLQEKPHIGRFIQPHTGLCYLAGGRLTDSSLCWTPRRSRMVPGFEPAPSSLAGGSCHHPFLCPSLWLETWDVLLWVIALVFHDCHWVWLWLS